VDAPLLLTALHDRGITATLEVWDDPDVDWDRFDAVVVRSTWDYTSRREEFLSWAKACSFILNPYEMLEYSSDKHYLIDLAERGVDVVETRVVEVGETPQLFDADVVVKPAIGAGSADAARYSVEEVAEARAHVADLHRQNRAALVQPYVDSVDSRGERALVFIGGQFSHALTKAAMLNTPAEFRDATFRRAQMSGANAEPAALDLARRALEPFADALYARVDLVESDAEWRVMELELVEPNLFFAFGEGAADRFADALLTRLR
jgi:glutathione synthase/RimK-type ligase-like ATP-grasp enzyme